MRRSVSKIKLRRGVRRLQWRDRVRENSVVRRFGPKNNERAGEGLFNVLILNNLRQKKRVSSDPLGPADVGGSEDGARGAALPSLSVGLDSIADMEMGRFEVNEDGAVEVHKSESRASEEKSEVISKYVVPPLVQVAGSDECHGTENAGTEEDHFPVTGSACEDQLIGQRLPLKHGGLIERMPRPVGHADEGRGLDSMEVSSVSYLSVPDTPGSRRPSTADFVIEKLQVERVDGGGLSIQGVALASNCHVTLCVFGIFFLLAGVILSYVSYSIRMEEDNPEGLEPETNKKNQKDDESSVVQMRIIGPSFLALGLLMLLLGCSLYGLARKINRDEKEKRRKISEQQVCQLQSSFSYGQANTGSPLHTATAPAAHQQYPILAVRRTSWWMDPTPIENPAPDVGEQPTSERRDSTGHAASPHGGSVNGSLPSLMSPVPPEVKPSSADTQRDIACFPPSTNPVPSSRPATATAGDPSATETSFSGSQDSSRPPTSGGPPTSAHHGRSSVEFVPSDFTYYQNTGYMVPFIQVTAPPPTGPVLPRLSRHAATRIDSRPTTADSR